MSLFVRERRSVIMPMPDTPWVWGLRGGSESTAGQAVNSETARRQMAVWRCQHLLADIVAGLPIAQYREQSSVRKRMPASEFVRSPSDRVSAEEWRYQLMLSALDNGNAYAVVTKRDSAQRVLRAEVAPPSEVTVDVPRSWAAPPTYKVSGKTVDDPEDILHFRAFGPLPGSVLGMSPIAYAAQTIGLGLAVRSYGAEWYAGGGHPTTALLYDQPLDADQSSEAKARFKAATTDEHVAAFGAGWKVETIGQSPEAALFLNATNATAVDICGYFGVPPEMLGYATSGGGSVTYANREQRMLDFLATTGQWWINRMERFISARIPQPQFVKINVDALLRSDAATRWNIHTQAVRAGVHSPDDVRRIEDEEPLANGHGDVYLWPPYGVKDTAGTESDQPVGDDPTITGGAA